MFPLLFFALVPAPWIATPTASGIPSIAKTLGTTSHSRPGISSSTILHSTSKQQYLDDRSISDVSAEKTSPLSKRTGPIITQRSTNVVWHVSRGFTLETNALVHLLHSIYNEALGHFGPQPIPPRFVGQYHGLNFYIYSFFATVEFMDLEQQMSNLAALLASALWQERVANFHGNIYDLGGRLVGTFMISDF